MDTNIPSVEEVRAALLPLTLRQIDRLAELSTVPASTISKIKYGATINPGIETVGMFMPHIAAVLREQTAPIEPQATS